MSEAEEPTTSRPTRERKATQRLEPEKAKATKSFDYDAGTGTPLGDIPLFRHATDKLAGDDDVLVMLHTLFFGSAGKHTMRKRQLRLFAGFPDESPSRASLVEKVTNSKKWTVSALKTAAGLFGLEKGGSRDDIVERFVDFVVSPSELKGVPTSTPKTSKKRKSAKKTKKDTSDKPKRALTPYIVFSQAKREEIKAENPEATFGEVAKLLGAAWKALGDDGKAEWVEAAAAAAADAGGDSHGGKKKRRKRVEKEEDDDDQDEEEEQEDNQEDREEDDQEEGGGDETLAPNSDDEA